MGYHMVLQETVVNALVSYIVIYEEGWEVGRSYNCM